MKQRTMYSLMATGGVVGVIAAGLQTTEKIQLLKNKDAVLACDLNSIFNCTDVLNAWQSAVFGFPNSIMCLVLFTIFATIAVVGLSGGVLPRKVRLGTQLLSLFTLCFAIWFLLQSIYVINALCILCIFCFGGLLLVNAMWLRINAADLPIGERGRAWMKRRIETGIDVLAWVLLAVAMALAMVIHFY